MANKAKKTKKPAATREDDTNVVRIRASAPAASSKDTESAEETVTTKVKAVGTKTTKAEKPKTPKEPKAGHSKGPAKVPGAIGGYFMGAWFELRQVRWPNRRATWGMTGAVIAYSAFFVVFVLLMDAGFKYLFDLILKK